MAGGQCRLQGIHAVRATESLHTQQRLQPTLDLQAVPTRAVLLGQQHRGARLVELLKQPQYEPMPAHEQVISIYAATKGFMDSIPVSEVRAFEKGLLDDLRSSKAALVEEIKTKQALDKEIEAKLGAAINEFKKGFKA